MNYGGFRMESLIPAEYSVPSNIHLTFCGSENCLPQHSYGPAVREHFLLHYICSGKGRFYSGETEYVLTAGDGFVIFPGDVTFYQADRESPWSYVWIGFDGQEAMDYLEKCGIHPSRPIFHCEESQTLSGLVEKMIQSNTLSYANEVRLQGLLLLFFSCLMESAHIPYSAASRNSLYIGKAIAYIQNNYQNPITVQDIASYVSLNRSYLSAVFQKNLHLSPQQFLMNYRISKAAGLLATTEIPISNIARSCGYADPLAFSKAFKKVRGQSPQKFRVQKRSAQQLLEENP